MNFKYDFSKQFSRKAKNKKLVKDSVLYLSPEKEIKQDGETTVLKASSLNPDLKEPAPKKLTPHQSGQSLKSDLTNLCSLISNVTESYTTAIFIRSENKDEFEVGGAQTLSLDFKYDAKISEKRGLVGWCLANKQQLCVSPFEQDARALLYYKKDQSLKSFVAVPVLDEENEVVAVIACDSKKNYAFARIAEKFLIDFGRQVNSLLELHSKVSPEVKAKISEKSKDSIIEELSKFQDEQSLMEFVAKLPEKEIKREALVILTTASDSCGSSAVYTTNNSQFDQRLFQLVCRQNKIVYSEQEGNDNLNYDDNRSFLSIPIQALGKDAGSINFLSKDGQAFCGDQVARVENIAKELGKCLERLRLLERFKNSENADSSKLSWPEFTKRAELELKAAHKDKTSLTLVRVAQNNLAEIESLCGIDVANASRVRVKRLLEQVTRQNGLVTSLYGSQTLILGESNDMKRIVLRFRNLVSRLNMADLSLEEERPEIKIGKLIMDGISFTSSNFPSDGHNISDLCSRTLCASDEQVHKAS